MINSKSTDGLAKSALGSHHVTVHDIDTVVRHPSSSTVMAALSHHLATDKHAKYVIAKHPDLTMGAISVTEHMSPEMLDKYSDFRHTHRDEQNQVHYAVVSHPNVSEKTLTKVVNSSDPMYSSTTKERAAKALVKKKMVT